MLIENIAKDPEKGDIIPKTGGCRKLKYSRDNYSGKRGGVRVIYYFYNVDNPIYMLLAYPKNVKENITDETKNILKKMVADLKRRAL